ncbi:MAG: DUF294 nucleotidyltransferase-like domain-containing protein [Saprospiraceae bacterium]
MKNEIVHRIYDFIREYPPFKYIDKDDLLALSTTAVVKYAPKNTPIFSVGEPPADFFYIVNTGAVALSNDRDEVLDVCDEGDVFGIRPLIAHSAYLLNAIAQEESVIYAIAINNFLPLLEKYNKISIYLATNFAVGTSTVMSSIGVAQMKQRSIYSELYTVNADKKPIHITQTHSIQDAAKLMTDHGIGSLIICDDSMKPTGIITDKDLRIKVVAGDCDKNTAVSEIMSNPVICMAPNKTLGEYQMILLANRISHVVITEDGTDKSPLVAVISEHDLVVQQADNPAILIKEIMKSDNVNALADIRKKMTKLLKKYMEQDIAIPFITTIISELNDAIIKRCIQISEEKLGVDTYSSIDYCWLTLGSEGRQEQLLLTDQDNALIYVQDDTIQNIKEKCLALAGEVTSMLHTIGYEYCPADMMASNPQWCQSVDEWQRTFENWMFQPTEKDIMLSTIFFDYRPIYKNPELAKQLTQFVFSKMEGNSVFLHLLAKNALENPPPLSFFRNFVLEKNGEHKDSFDIKLRAMMPLVDAARVLILENRIWGINNTIERFKILAEHDTNNAELYTLAADAYAICLGMRTEHGLRNEDSGRYIKPDDMDKMDRLQLRNAFQPIDQLQQILKIRFQL